MIPSAPTWARPAAVALFATLLTGCNDAPQPTEPRFDELRAAESYWTPGRGQEPFKVYTQNAYLGGDTGPLFTLDFDFSNPANLIAVLNAVNTFWGEVQASDIPGRAAALVDQIADRRPHLVGLQEVVQFGVVDLTTPEPSVVGGADLLATVQFFIQQRGLPYDLVTEQANTSATLPMEFDFATLSPTKILAFTDRLAVLRRNDVAISSVAQGTYAAAYDLGPLTLERGWIRATADVAGVPYHFVVTHLETQGLAPVQAGQATELIHEVLRGLGGVTVLAGDLNSDAANPGAPSWTPTYDAIIADGFTDAWLKYTDGDEGPGYTCCQDPGLDNFPSALNQRIDFVLVRDARSSSGVAPGGMRVEIVGEEEGDLTTSGLWPADHAGLFAGLRMPKGIR